MKKLSKTILLALITASGIAVAADRDPFLPYTWSTPAATTDTNSANINTDSKISPLIDKPLSAYTVIGVVVSPNDALAVLKSRDKREYFAYIGDPVGSEGGVLETINTEGISVDMGGKIVTLKVSNRFEMQDEKQDEKK